METFKERLHELLLPDNIFNFKWPHGDEARTISVLF